MGVVFKNLIGVGFLGKPNGRGLCGVNSCSSGGNVLTFGSRHFQQNRYLFVGVGFCFKDGLFKRVFGYFTEGVGANKLWETAIQSDRTKLWSSQVRAVGYYSYSACEFSLSSES